jgi:hypothetical protein
MAPLVIHPTWDTLSEGEREDGMVVAKGAFRVPGPRERAAPPRVGASGGCSCGDSCRALERVELQVGWVGWLMMEGAVQTPGGLSRGCCMNHGGLDRSKGSHSR